MGTERLFERDPYLREFEGRVVRCEAADGGYLAVLDRTAFYPEGGGQPCDRGTLGSARVLDVQERDGVVFHTVDAPVEIGDTLRGVIDWERRFDHMQQHSGEHIVSGMLCEHFGCDNVGFHMGEDIVTIDYNADIPWEALLEVEEAANRYLWEDHPVDIRFHRGAELAAIPYRSKKEIPGDVRIVTFPGADCCACCGTHVASSAQVGLVKFLSVQKFRQGVRIELLCGGRARRYLSRCWEQARSTGQALSVKPEGSHAAVEKLMAELAARKAEAAQWQTLAFRGIAQSVAGRGDVLLFQPPMEGTALRRLADAAAEECGGLAAVFAGEDGRWSYALCRRGGEVSAETKTLNAALHGRGGGRGPLAQGSVPGSRAEIEVWFDNRTKG